MRISDGWVDESAGDLNVIYGRTRSQSNHSNPGVRCYDLEELFSQIQRVVNAKTVTVNGGDTDAIVTAIEDAGYDVAR